MKKGISTVKNGEDKSCCMQLRAVACVFIWLFFPLLTFGQDKSEEKKFLKAQDLYANEQYDSALTLFNQLLRDHPKNPYYNFFTGACFVNTKTNLSTAAQHLKFTLANTGTDEFEIRQDAHLYLGKAFHLSGNFDEAIAAFQSVSDQDPERKLEAYRFAETCRNAKQLVKSPVNVKIENLGSPINSKYPDHSPLIRTDESMLLFTSSREGNTGNKKTEDGSFFEDIYVSVKEREYWGRPENLGPPVNTGQHEATVALSVDGEKLLLYRGGINSIFMAEKTGNGWGEPKKLGPSINSGYSETSASFSADGKTLYFVSSRKGGKGKKDIYKSELLENGQWGAAVNLGSTVNTPEDEESPFIHPDNKTLFFSSKGHNGMGGFDIYKSELNGESWSQPQNAGFPVNSVTDDVHFILTARGDNGYFVSSRPGGLGMEDIYLVSFPKANIPLTMVRGTIVTGKNKPVKVKIKIIDKEINKEIKHVYSPNPETGKYLMIFPPGKNYQMLVEAEGYEPFAFNLHIPNQSYFYELYQTIYLKAVAPFGETIGQGISIENTFYDIRDSLQVRTAEKVHDSLLLAFIDKIIRASDTASLGNLAPENTTGSAGEILSLAEKIIGHTDSSALLNLDRITQRGFFEKADSNIYFYDTLKLYSPEPFRIGNDTIFILPSVTEDSITRKMVAGLKTPIKEKIDEVSIKSILNLHVYFAFNDSGVIASYADTLRRISQLLSLYPKLKADISGHTDNKGTDEYNQKLSERRASAIAAYFVQKGIDPARLIIEGKGESRPVTGNGTEAGRAKNRRVEIRLTEYTIKQKIIQQE